MSASVSFKLYSEAKGKDMYFCIDCIPQTGILKCYILLDFLCYKPKHGAPLFGITPNKHIPNTVDKSTNNMWAK